MDKANATPLHPKRAKYLVSRQALLDDLQATEKQLGAKVTTVKSNTPYFQELLLKRYVSLQDDLQKLKAYISKTVTPTETDISTERWDAKNVTDEINALLQSYNSFLVNTGFMPGK
jgi:hypothetical protein